MNKTIDPESTITSISRFLVEKLDRSGLSGYVIGLSGGIDSALSATLAVKAVGVAKVYGVLMPYKTSSPESRKDASEVAEWLGIDHRVVDISPMIDAYYPEITDTMRIRAGNKMARERMSILFDVAHGMKRMVLGTGNRTEIALGYTTWYGDAACSLNPVGQLYKTDVRMLAKHLDLPQAVQQKKPSADLWVGQTDEGEIGVTYDEIDRLLVRILDDGERSKSVLEKEGFNGNNIDRVITLINGNAFKRNTPAIAQLGKNPVPDSVQLDA